MAFFSQMASASSLKWKRQQSQMMAAAAGLVVTAVVALWMLWARLPILLEKPTQPSACLISVRSCCSSHSKLPLSGPIRPTQVQIKWFKSLARTRGWWALLGTVQGKDGNRDQLEN